MKSTMDFSAQAKELSSALSNADAIIVGAGAGLSVSAGFVYDGKRFHENFHDFEARYNFHDMYSGAFYPYPTPEEHWAYWSKFVFLNRYLNPPKPVYKELYDLVKNKEYFVITTNVDHCFQKSGFDKSRLFYTQGDYGLFQCSVPCHDNTYDNEDTIRRMVSEQKNLKIQSELVPRCPRCGKPLSMNLRSDNTFVEDDGWRAACARYEEFIKKHKKSKLLLLELGVGWNTPVIIKYPFWRLTANNDNTTYACINYGEAMCPDEIKPRAILINEDIGKVIEYVKLLRGDKD